MDTDTETGMNRCKTILAAAALAVAGLAPALYGPPAQAQQKAKVFLSMSYVGNDWQAEASNMVKAMAAHSSMAGKIDLQVQVAGQNAQKHNQQITAIVQPENSKASSRERVGQKVSV